MPVHAWIIMIGVSILFSALAVFAIVVGWMVVKAEAESEVDLWERGQLIDRQLFYLDGGGGDYGAAYRSLVGQPEAWELVETTIEGFEVLFNRSLNRCVSVKPHARQCNMFLGGPDLCGEWSDQERDFFDGLALAEAVKEWIADKESDQNQGV